MCSAEHFISFAEKSITKKRIIFKNVLNKQFISFSKETIFETILLNSLTANMLINHTSFIGYTNAYNYLFEFKTSYIKDTKKFKHILLI